MNGKDIFAIPEGGYGKAMAPSGSNAYGQPMPAPQRVIRILTFICSWIFWKACWRSPEVCVLKK
jgi:hypothetical protein